MTGKSILTPKQEAFCKAVADGLGQSEAYRKAYDAKGSKPETVQVKASRMMREDKIRLRIEQLRSALEEKDLWKREDSVRALIDVIQKDLGAKPADKIRAVSELNKMHGWQSQTIDLKNSDGSLRVEFIKVE